jgi:hypothetical protein
MDQWISITDTTERNYWPFSDPAKLKLSIRYRERKRLLLNFWGLPTIQLEAQGSND